MAVIARQTPSLLLDGTTDIGIGARRPIRNEGDYLIRALPARVDGLTRRLTDSTACGFAVASVTAYGAD